MAKRLSCSRICAPSSVSCPICGGTIIDDPGQRAFIGKCCMDRNAPNNYIETAESSLAATHDFLDHFESSPIHSASKAQRRIPLVQPILTPRFAVSCTPTLLSALGALSASRKPSLPVQTHQSENPLECLWVKEMFAAEAGGDAWGETYAGIYEHYGLLGPGTILAHCVHLDDTQREIIRRTGAGVSHCPGSNLYLGSGAARVREMLDVGIKVRSTHRL
jgi:guanine deaminase